MNKTRDGQCEKREDVAGGTPEPRSSGSRRLLLGAAAGGFALAASELLLAEWLMEEAEADNHPVRGVQDRKQQKRDKQRHKLEHNRRRKRRTNGNEQDTPLGSDPWVPRIAIAVHNYRNSAVRLRGWQVANENGCGPDCAVWEMPTVWNWRSISGFTPPNQHGHTEFVSARAHIAVEITDGFAVEAKISYNGNGSPMKGYMDVTIWKTREWGTYGESGDSYPLKSDTRMWINTIITSGGRGISAKNVGIADSGHAVLSVDVSQV